MIKGREGTRPTFRVGQLDAEQLDEELLDLLKGQVGEALKYFDVGLVRRVHTFRSFSSLSRCSHTSETTGRPRSI